jgi:hypothetical protein
MLVGDLAAEGQGASYRDKRRTGESKARHVVPDPHARLCLSRPSQHHIGHKQSLLVQSHVVGHEDAALGAAAAGEIPGFVRTFL